MRSVLFVTAHSPYYWYWASSAGWLLRGLLFLVLILILILILFLRSNVTHYRIFPVNELDDTPSIVALLIDSPLSYPFSRATMNQSMK